MSTENKTAKFASEVDLNKKELLGTTHPDENGRFLVPDEIRKLLSLGPDDSLYFYRDPEGDIKLSKTPPAPDPLAASDKDPSADALIVAADQAASADTEVIFSVDSLCKKYASFELDNVSFSLKKGRIMGFIGRNGAGKTTTLKCSLDLVQPDSGKVLFFGKPLYGNEKEILKHIGFASGGVDYFKKKKIKDIVSVTKTFYDNWDDDSYNKYMSAFGIDENKISEELSAGMKVKLNLVFALSHHAKLFLLDEPTSGLDPVSRDEIMMLFEHLRDEGCSLLFSTHVTSDLDKCADDITYIHNGKILASMPKEEFIRSNSEHGTNVEEIMLYYERKHGSVFEF